MKNNENRAICSACGGKCCKCSPGFAVPRDFLRMPIFYLGREYWQVVTHYADSRNWQVVMPQTSGGGIYGTCCFLGVLGCVLEWEFRPFECRHLKPVADEDGRCEARIKRDDIAPDWIQFQAELAEYDDPELFGIFEKLRKEHPWKRVVDLFPDAERRII
jgi:hypothetical protein